ncbi:metal-dependent transcriptional regulator [Gordonia sp. CPCC 205515]|uniref:metal-dependent transcriptional regulator n=1 Tax=Gordonia sp. CPCC 205515 TaxID=3140791 RepID=UPI003AF3D8A8
MTAKDMALVTPLDPLADLTDTSCAYLRAIWVVGERNDGKVTTTSLADELGVAASTVSTALRKLVDKDLVTHPRYGAIRLTHTGIDATIRIIRRLRLLETFLVRELGYGWHEVHDDADVLALAASDRFIDRIDQRLGHPTRDPHGDPIPAADGTLPRLTLTPLAECATGVVGTVARIDDSDPAMLEYFHNVGLTLDRRVTIGVTRPFAGTMSVVPEGSNTDVVLGDVAAQSIWITLAPNG